VIKLGNIRPPKTIKNSPQLLFFNEKEKLKQSWKNNCFALAKGSFDMIQRMPRPTAIIFFFSI